MLPNYKVNNLLIVYNWFDNLQIGDVVIARFDDKKILKRVQKINNNSLFLIGDNPKESTDSRSFGWIKRYDILAKVIFRL